LQLGSHLPGELLKHAIQYKYNARYFARHVYTNLSIKDEDGDCRWVQKLGKRYAVAASLGLIGHHLFGAWNGDRRLRIRYDEAFDIVKSRTSVLPFAAILDGRQKLPKDYYKEFIRLPYLVITGLTLGAYFAHPLMQAASLSLHW
ncbi:15-cis-zeta-carotene isomerase, chloroplastic, partial [Tanacetum coccineum]